MELNKLLESVRLAKKDFININEAQENLEQQVSKVLTEFEKTLSNKDNLFTLETKVFSSQKNMKGESIFRVFWTSMNGEFKLKYQILHNSSYETVSKPDMEQKLNMISVLPDLVQELTNNYKAQTEKKAQATKDLLEKKENLLENLPSGFKEWVQTLLPAKASLPNNN